MSIITPKYNLQSFPDVYEPSEDTFLLLDALECDTQFLLDLKPRLVVEIGSGSGVVISALSQIFHTSCMYFATDINPQCCLATQNTCILNDSNVECTRMDLLVGFREHMFDVIIFNPPYVVTQTVELYGSGLNRAWAGGLRGRVIIDRLVNELPKLLSKNGVCYMVLLKENEPDEIVKTMDKYHFKSEVVLERKIPGERLFVYKFFRMSA
ncbi:hemK methyltransferase 2 [Leptinotarsa decemlineata]|uniref:hemK methyltransferase 2 n=1 Tax=Leptinotarsa decemlineata TaxID=7539 RepID=UPI003D30D68B